MQHIAAAMKKEILPYIISEMAKKMS